MSRLAVTAGDESKLFATFIPAANPSQGGKPIGVSVLAKDLQVWPFDEVLSCIILRLVFMMAGPSWVMSTDECVLRPWSYSTHIIRF